MISARMSEDAEGSIPRLSITRAASSGTPDSEIWEISWRVANLTREPLEIVEGWLPRGRFYSKKEAFAPPIILSAVDNVLLSREVRCLVEPGEVIENAFLILGGLFRDHLWRVLTRLRVEREASGAVRPVIEAVTAHPVGFALPLKDPWPLPPA